MTTLEALSAMPSAARLGTVALDKRPDRLEADVGREEEELDRHKLLRAPLGGVAEEAVAREPPDDDRAREALDRRVDAEADERDRAGQDSREDRDAALERHPAEAEPGEQLHPSGEPPVLALGQGPAPAAAVVTRDRRLAGKRESSVRPLRRQRVQHHLAFASRGDEPRAAERAEVMGHEVLGALGNPGEVAHAELVGLGQRSGQREAGRIAERLGALGEPLASGSGSRAARSRSAFGRSRHKSSQRSSATRAP